MPKLHSISIVSRGLLLAMLAVSCDCTNFQVPSAESDKHAAKLDTLSQQIAQLPATFQREVQALESQLSGALATLKQDVQAKVQGLADKHDDHKSNPAQPPNTPPKEESLASRVYEVAKDRFRRLFSRWENT